MALGQGQPARWSYPLGGPSAAADIPPSPASPLRSAPLVVSSKRSGPPHWLQSSDEMARPVPTAYPVTSARPPAADC